MAEQLGVCPLCGEAMGVDEADIGCHFVKAHGVDKAHPSRWECPCGCSFTWVCSGLFSVGTHVLVHMARDEMASLYVTEWLK